MSDKTYASLNTLKTFLDNIKILMDNHNTTTDSHNDIRVELEEIATRLSTLADCDDETLDQISEIVQYVKDNRELIQQITTDKVSVSDIIDNLTTNVTNKPLSAAQGVVLKNMITELDEIADYIIEKGATDGWKWEKWNSGKYICYGVFNDTCTTFQTVTPFYVFASTAFMYPISFKDKPVVLFSCKTSKGYGIPVGDIVRSTIGAKCYCLSTENDTIDIEWEIYVVGRWK